VGKELGFVELATLEITTKLQHITGDFLKSTFLLLLLPERTGIETVPYSEKQILSIKWARSIR
jgi:hypothetical protein